MVHSVITFHQSEDANWRLPGQEAAGLTIVRRTATILGCHSFQLLQPAVQMARHCLSATKPLICRGSESTGMMPIDKNGRGDDHIKKRWNWPMCSGLILVQAGLMLSKSATKLAFHGTPNFLLCLIAKPQLSGSLSGGCC